MSRRDGTSLPALATSDGPTEAQCAAVLRLVARRRAQGLDTDEESANILGALDIVDPDGRVEADRAVTKTDSLGRRVKTHKGGRQRAKARADAEQEEAAS